MRYVVIAFHSGVDRGTANDPRLSILPTVRMSEPTRVKTVSEPILITTFFNFNGIEME
jgi:hypothetical protein